VLLPYGLICQRSFHSPWRTARLPKTSQARTSCSVRTESTLPASIGPHDLPISGGRSGWVLLDSGCGDSSSVGIRSATCITLWLMLPAGRFTLGPLTISELRIPPRQPALELAEWRHRHWATSGHSRSRSPVAPRIDMVCDQLIDAKRKSRVPGNRDHPEKVGALGPLSPKKTKMVFSYSPICFRWSTSRRCGGPCSPHAGIQLHLPASTARLAGQARSDRERTTSVQQLGAGRMMPISTCRFSRSWRTASQPLSYSPTCRFRQSLADGRVRAAPGAPRRRRTACRCPVGVDELISLSV